MDKRLRKPTEQCFILVWPGLHDLEFGGYFEVVYYDKINFVETMSDKLKKQILEVRWKINHAPEIKAHHLLGEYDSLVDKLLALTSKEEGREPNWPELLMDKFHTAMHDRITAYDVSQLLHELWKNGKIQSPPPEEVVAVKISKILDIHLPPDGVGTERERLRMALHNDFLKLLNQLTKKP